MRWQAGGVSYPSDLTDRHWQRLEPFFERPDPRSARSKYPKRRVVWQEAVAVLGRRWREVALGRARRAPRHTILDSQAVKTAAEGQERGLDGGKKVKGRSRHVAVDSQGTLLAVCTCARPTKPTAQKQAR